MMNNENKDCITHANDQESIFLYTTITGNLQLIRMEHIGYFHYCSQNKLWEIRLNNGRVFTLRRNTNSQKILNMNPLFIQISQTDIININYLASIEGNNCKLLPPFQENKSLQISKSFIKKLKDRFLCI